MGFSKSGRHGRFLGRDRGRRVAGLLGVVAAVGARHLHKHVAGRDVRVGRFAASEHCSYAMFAGGGLSWVETEAKRGGGFRFIMEAGVVQPQLAQAVAQFLEIVGIDRVQPAPYHGD